MPRPYKRDGHFTPEHAESSAIYGRICFREQGPQSCADLRRAIGARLTRDGQPSAARLSVSPAIAAIGAAKPPNCRHCAYLGWTPTTSLWLTAQGAPLSERAIDRVIRLVGATAGLQLSAHVLRHTFCTNLVRQHNDLILVAELAGHTRLETLRRYSLPTSADRQAAVDALTIDY